MTIGVYSHNDVVAYVEFKNGGKVVDTMKVGNWALEDTLQVLRQYNAEIIVHRH